jgi:mRNA-degrading endonuclease RelE of RelBE toxin-antitoxin system
MKKFGMRYTSETSRLLSKLHPESKKQIRAALEELRNNPYAGSDLQEELYLEVKLNKLYTGKIKPD